MNYLSSSGTISLAGTQAIISVRPLFTIPESTDSVDLLFLVRSVFERPLRATTVLSRSQFPELPIPTQTNSHTNQGVR